MADHIQTYTPCYLLPSNWASFVTSTLIWVHKLRSWPWNHLLTTLHRCNNPHTRLIIFMSPLPYNVPRQGCPLFTNPLQTYNGPPYRTPRIPNTIKITAFAETYFIQPILNTSIPRILRISGYSVNVHKPKALLSNQMYQMYHQFLKPPIIFTGSINALYYTH